MKISTKRMFIFWLVQSGLIATNIIFNYGEYHQEYGAISLVITLGFMFYWFLGDAKENNVTASITLKSCIIFFSILSLPYYLIKYKGLKRFGIGLVKLGGFSALIFLISLGANYLPCMNDGEFCEDYLHRVGIYEDQTAPFYNQISTKWLSGPQEVLYPWEARRKGYEGSAVISFTITDSGSISNVRVNETSGHAILDSAAVAAARAFNVNLVALQNEMLPLKKELKITFELDS